MKKRHNIIIIVIVSVLVVVIGITAYLNKDTAANKTQLNNDAIFKVMENGEEIKSYNMSQIQILGEVKFYADLKSDGTDAVKYLYTGVPLINILEDAGVNIDGKEAAIVSAIDGYIVSVSMDKVLNENNVYLTYMRGDELLGTREGGGDGPYQLIISKDKFSQFWCKYAYSVELN